jgi:hydroxymethylpyrimidine/phosphomethylpyrimidine kinase
MDQAAPGTPVVLTIAGFDPTAGAGIAADLKTFAAHNCYGVAAITALTVQNTAGVSAVQPVAAKLLRATLDALSEDIAPAVIKIGMLANAENTRAVAAWLERFPETPVVLDPILRSTSGATLLDEPGFKELRKSLLLRATVATPNIDEAARLSGSPVGNLEEMKHAARELVAAGVKAVLITGGHLDKAIDILFDGHELKELPGDRIKTEHTHGTGCAFSSAVAANLALGKGLLESAVLAKAYVQRALEKSIAVGAGHGSPNHFYRFQQVAPPRAGGGEPHHMSSGHR